MLRDVESTLNEDLPLKRTAVVCVIPHHQCHSKERKGKKNGPSIK